MKNQTDNSCTQNGTAASTTEPGALKRDCCSGKKQLNEMVLRLSQKGKSAQPQTVFKCGCRCGKNKLLGLLSTFSHETIPNRFAEGIAP
ncbi:MAG: hypothetical protein HXX11_21790 [Desulfuromonadales bacterium]|nr:hypothetical protein [Desulfuromonadales bacterium]